MTFLRARALVRAWPLRPALLGLGASALGGCVDAFEPQSELSSVRVLAVRPSPASGSPGAEVKLDMLLHDASVPPGASASDAHRGGVLALPLRRTPAIRVPTYCNSRASWTP